MIFQFIGKILMKIFAPHIGFQIGDQLVYRGHIFNSKLKSDVCIMKRMVKKIEKFLNDKISKSLIMSAAKARQRGDYKLTGPHTELSSQLFARAERHINQKKILSRNAPGPKDLLSFQ